MMPPASPVFNFAAGLRPSSPPESPTTCRGPTQFLPKISTGAGSGSGPACFTPQHRTGRVAHHPNGLFFTNGHLNHLRPENLSPCSPDNSSVAEVSEPDEPELADDEDDPDSPASLSSQPGTDGRYVSETRILAEGNFVIEELTDFDAIDVHDVISPHAIEYAGSELAPDDLRMISNLKNLKCGSDAYSSFSSSSEESDLEAHEAILRANRAAERTKRMSQSSIGTKRTISERGSDSEHEDVRHYIGFDEPGSSARRLKRRIAGDRRSLNFSDPPPRIDEAIEPEELEEALARELPFYEYTSMEIDSPRSP